jgi:hypothetical protein
MKKIILLVVSSLAIAICTAPAGQGVYVDEWHTSNGKPIIVAYDLAVHVAHLFMPDGRDVTVAYDPAITKETLDAGLRKLADKEADK